jgi:hypothetical protein
MISASFLTEKCVILCSYNASHVPPNFTYPFRCTKSNLYLTNFMATLVRDPDLYRLLMFNVPNFTSLFFCLGCTRDLVQVQGLVECFVTLLYLWWGVVSTLPDPQTRGPLLVGCLRLLIQYIGIYPPYPETVSPSATWRCTMPWWWGPTYHGSTAATTSTETFIVYILQEFLFGCSSSIVDVVFLLLTAHWNKYRPYNLCFILSPLYPTILTFASFKISVLDCTEFCVENFKIIRI